MADQAGKVDIKYELRFYFSFFIRYSSFPTITHFHPSFQNNIELEGIDIAGDLEELKKNIAKFKKGKYKDFGDFGMDDLDWMDQNARRVKAVTIFIYETSV